MSEQNKATSRRVFEEIVTQGKLGVADEVFTADYCDHDPTNEEDVRGPDGVKQEFAAYRTAFPDLYCTIEDQLADGDKVVTRFTARGTHRGELMGVAASGRSVQIEGIAIHRLANGRIEEGWWSWDTVGLLQQIGAMPAEALT